LFPFAFSSPLSFPFTGSVLAPSSFVASGTPTSVFRCARQILWLRLAPLQQTAKTNRIYTTSEVSTDLPMQTANCAACSQIINRQSPPSIFHTPLSFSSSGCQKPMSSLQASMLVWQGIDHNGRIGIGG
jgi:hypothetical protein